MGAFVRKVVHFGSFLGALILFFMPWVGIQCSGRTVATQSGVQVIYGGVSLAEDLNRMAKKESSSKKDGDGPGWGFLVGLALLSVIAGLVFSARALFKNIKPLLNPAVWALLAFILIMAQWVTGFPVDDKLSDTPDPSVLLSGDRNAQPTVDTRKLKWFYYELLVLAIPAGMLVHQIVKASREAARDPDEEGEKEKKDGEGTSSSSDPPASSSPTDAA